MIWNPTYEMMSREEITKLQEERLRALVYKLYNKVPFYQKKLDDAGVKPEDIKSLADITKLPFTTKDDLRNHYPYGLFISPLKDIVRIHASSGTTGHPTAVGYTRKDLDTWSELVARVVSQAGVTDEDIVQISFGYGLFTGGFGLHYGLEKVGAAVVPASSGNTRRQIQLMQDFHTTALVSTPSYALYLAEVAMDMGIDPNTLKVRLGLFGGEPWSEGMRVELEKLWPNMKATDNYGLSEVMGPGVSGECTRGRGMHVAEDHFIPEVIDPDTGEVLPPGEQGELVLTPLTKEGFAVLRYRTRDITSLNYEPCPCGRTHVRMEKVTGRTDDMLIIRGVNVYPSQIETVLTHIPGVGPHYLLVVSRTGRLDTLEVQVELSKDCFAGTYKQLEELRRTVEEQLRSTFGISPVVKLVEYKSLERTAGKSQRVIDKRKIGE
ncbi:MAG: phenylacetate--CoA ligase [Limnochordia bacterium]|nr:phenylacetate--CoA ligase [Limnochordia bacterium]